MSVASVASFPTPKRSAFTASIFAQTSHSCGLEMQTLPCCQQAAPMEEGTNHFQQHAASHVHYLAMHQWSAECRPVDVLLNVHLQEQQATAAKRLMIIAGSVRYVAHEGPALWGHTHDSGHLHELLKLRTADVPELQLWLDRHNSYTSSDVQNELMPLKSQAVPRKLATDISAIQPLQFAVIVNSTSLQGGTGLHMHQNRRQRPGSARNICRNICSKRHTGTSAVEHYNGCSTSYELTSDCTPRSNIQCSINDGWTI